jgi:hypothetical protein
MNRRERAPNQAWRQSIINQIMDRFVIPNGTSDEQQIAIINEQLRLSRLTNEELQRELSQIQNR